MNYPEPVPIQITVTERNPSLNPLPSLTLDQVKFRTRLTSSQIRSLSDIGLLRSRCAGQVRLYCPADTALIAKIVSVGVGWLELPDALVSRRRVAHSPKAQASAYPSPMSYPSYPPEEAA